MIRQLVEMPVQETNVRCAECARGTGSDPGYRVSHESVARKRVTKRTRCEHGQTGASHTTHHKHLSTGVVSAVIPSKGAFSERFEFVEEVVVLATVVEVGVHDEGRGTGDGSGAHFLSKLQRR